MRTRRSASTATRVAKTVELTVDALGGQGDGIGRYNGVPVFVPLGVPGDRVRVALGSRRGDAHEGRIVELVEASARRAEPACRHFGRCGGCTLQQLTPEDYRAVKLGALDATLRRVGIDPAIVAPLRTVPPARRRARLGIARPQNPDARTLIGFRRQFGHQLIDLAECPVLEPGLFAVVEPLRRIAPDLLAPGATAEAMLTRCDSGIDLLVVHAHPPSLVALEVLAAFAAERDLARIMWRAAGNDFPVVERRPARMIFSGTRVALPPGAFLQPSAAAEAILVEEVAAAIGERRPALDLYAGLGTFALALAAAGPVHAVEGDAAAVAALAQAAGRLPHVTVERRDLDHDPLTGNELARYAAAVFDPPRAGAARQAAALAGSLIETVVAVSCNPATFARDAARLVAGGYRLEHVRPIDQFVWTPHLELVGVFRR